MAVSFGTRKALGRRYSIDPALSLAQEELAQKYGLIPGQEARALQESQFGRNLAFTQEQADLNRESAEKSGMIGTIANTGLTAAMIRAMMIQGTNKSFFDIWGTPATVRTAGKTGMGLTSVSTPAMDATLGGASSSPAFTVNPALMGAESGAPAASNLGGAVAPTYGTTGLTGAGTGGGATGMGVGTGVTAVGAGLAAYMGAQQLNKYAPIGGEKEKDTAAYGAAGAATGAVIGGGYGAVIGGAIGVGYGVLKSIFGW